ncbi:hypothetical protein ACA910_020544 [Epithemia clementina (nom. ined.)]
MKVWLLVLTASLFLVDRSFAFLVSSPLGFPKKGYQQQQQQLQRPFSDTSLNVIPPQAAVDAAVTASASGENVGNLVLIVLVGVMLAAYQEYRIDEFATVKMTVDDFTKNMKKGENTESKNVVDAMEEALDPVPDPEPEPEPVSEPILAPKPAPVPVPQPKPVPVPQPKPVPVPQPKPAPVPQPKPAPVPQPKPAPEPVPEPEPEPVLKQVKKVDPLPQKKVSFASVVPPSQPKPEDTRPFISQKLNDLVRQVGSTIEQRRAMEELGNQRRRILESARQKERKESSSSEEEDQDSSTTAESASSSEADSSDGDNDSSESTNTGKSEPRRKSILRKALRITKKIIAPWRKWDNIK